MNMQVQVKILIFFIKIYVHYNGRKIFNVSHLLCIFKSIIR